MKTVRKGDFQFENRAELIIEKNHFESYCMRCYLGAHVAKLHDCRRGKHARIMLMLDNAKNVKNAVGRYECRCMFPGFARATVTRVYEQSLAAAMESI